MRPAYAPKTMAGKPPSVVVPAAMPPAYSSAQPVPADYSTSMTAKMTVAPNYAQPQAVSMVWLCDKWSAYVFYVSAHVLDVLLW